MAAADMIKRHRVLAAEFLHETNTFQKSPTTLDNFKKQIWLPSSVEVHSSYTSTKSSYGATFEMASQYDWDLTATISASANPSGKIADETFEYVCALILAPISAQDEPFDGIVLYLHGAMVTASYEDAEGELLHRIRSIKGYENVPIIVTLDLHGNITEKMASNANALIAVRTYPHIDFYERAIDACQLLQKCMLKIVRPVTVIAKIPVLPPRGLDGGRTQQGPMRELIDRSEVIEKDENNSILVISICAGFSASDIYDIGPSVTVTVDLSKTKSLSEEKVQINFAQRTARKFINHAWRNRDYTSVHHKTIDDAIAIAREYSLAYGSSNVEKRPMVMADVTDNPGSGHYGDATNVLSALIDSRLTNVLFYAIYDSHAAKQCAAIGVGCEGEVTLGGRHDPGVGGPPLALTGKVVTLADGCFPSFGPMGGGVWQNFGLSALFRVASAVDIIIISNNGQLLDLAQITSLGVDPLLKTIIAVKSNHHFRSCAGPIAGQIITLDGGGLGSTILRGTGVYNNVRRPIYPLDKDVDVDTDEDG